MNQSSTSLSSKFPFTLALNFTPNKQGYLSGGEYFTRAAYRLGMPIKLAEDTDDAILNIESEGHPFKEGKKVTGYYDLDVFLPRGFDMIGYQDSADVWFSSHKPPYKVRPGLPVVILPHACDPQLTLARRPKDYDVVISGRLDWNYHERREMAEKLAKEFNCLFVPPTRTVEYLNALSSGKIIFNCSLMGDVNRRDFDGMALGVLVTNRTKYTKMLGDEGRHYFAYNGWPQLKKVVKDVLKYPTIGRRTDEFSTKHVYKNHTYDRRLLLIYRKMADEMDKKAKGRSDSGSSLQ